MRQPLASTIDEAAARRVLLVQAHESVAGDNPLWTADDARWATRLARDTAAADSADAPLLVERARHALQRLQPRDAGSARLLARRQWRWLWLVSALLLGFVAGVAVDVVGAGQRINLLAPPVWAVVAWNLAVYLALLLPLRRTQPALQRLRGWLAQRLQRPLRGAPALAAFHAAWTRTAAPLLLARATLLLHAAAFALALGLIAGLYLRGLVLDYRAGWQSTFLDAAQVRAALSTLLAPASALTGIAVPDAAALQGLRVAPGAAPGAGQFTTAAPWIHLYAATLLLAVLGPRALLAAAAAWRARALSRRFALPLAQPYFQRLLRALRGGSAQVQVLALGAAASAQAAAGLQSLLAAGLGADVQLHFAGATAYGDEDAAPAPAPATTLRLVLATLAATPEDDSHGVFVRRLRAAAPALPVLVLVDEAGLRARYASLPARIDERRAAWRAWAQAQPVALLFADLARPDLADAESALTAALHSEAAP